MIAPKLVVIWTRATLRKEIMEMIFGLLLVDTIYGF